MLFSGCIFLSELPAKSKKPIETKSNVSLCRERWFQCYFFIEFIKLQRAYIASPPTQLLYNSFCSNLNPNLSWMPTFMNSASNPRPPCFLIHFAFSVTFETTVALPDLSCVQCIKYLLSSHCLGSPEWLPVSSWPAACLHGSLQYLLINLQLLNFIISLGLSH